jgi:D-alanyl-D-alanine-carboxypeptidase/D-alanyl-D-alanine-endopeptidase
MRAMSHSSVVAAIAAVTVACAPPATTPKTSTPVADAPDPTGPHRAAVAAQVQPYLDAELVSSLVVGVVDGDKVEIYGFGTRDETDPKPAPPDGRTVFEIGTLTQVFTSLLLADAVARGELSFDTPVARMMPIGVTLPTAGDQAITVEMLATHRAGLPSTPRSIARKQFEEDPYGGYAPDQLYGDLDATRLEAVPGTVVRYSSWGVGLLGFALARTIGMTYGEALNDRITGPLGLVDTRVDVPSLTAPRVAMGHDEDLRRVGVWHFSAMAGAAGLHSTARDLTALLRAEIAAAHGGKGPLADRLRATQEIRIPADPRSESLGWWVEKDGRYWHNGATGGHHAFVQLDPVAGRGVVVLAGTSTSLLDRLGGAIFDALAGKPPAPVAFPDPAQFAPLAGRYRIGDSEANVEIRGKRIYLVQPGQRPTRLLPLSAFEFFIEEIQAPMAFELDGGKAVGLVIFANGQRVEGKRVGDLPPAPPAPTPRP